MRARNRKPHFFRLINDARTRLDVESGASSGGDEVLSLRGDLLIKCFERGTPSDGAPTAAMAAAAAAADERSLLWQCQLNTCALEPASRLTQLAFYKPELDLVGKRVWASRDDEASACLQIRKSMVARASS